MLSAVYPVSRHCLGNGLRVVVGEDHAVPGVSVHVRYDAGSRHDPAGRGGLAHIAEHLMFAGSASVAAGEHARLVQAHGGVCNGVTSADAAVYFEHLPAGALELALWLEADRMATLPGKLTPEVLDVQRGVIAQERHEQEAGLFADTAERLAALVYPSGHPYSRRPVGLAGEVEAVTLGDVRDFLAARYHPGAAVLAIAGDVTPGQAFAAAERYLGQVPAGPAAGWPEPAVLGPLPAPARDDALAAVPFAAVAMGWRLPADAPDSGELLACDMALRIVAAGAASRAGRVLISARHAAQQVHAETDPRTAGNSLGLAAVIALPGVPASDAEDVIAGEAELLAARGPGEEDLARARAGAERDALTALSASLSRAYCLAYYEAAFGRPGLTCEAAARIQAVTAEQVRAAAATWLRPSSAAVVTTSPAPAHAGGKQS